MLTNRLIDILREEESGVYGVSANGGYSRRPYENYTLNISFPCAPDNVEKLTAAAYAEIEKIQAEGVSDEEVAEVQESQINDREENLRQNRFWLRQLSAYYTYDANLDDFYVVEDFMNDLSGEDIQAITNELIDTEKAIRIVLFPEGD